MSSEPIMRSRLQYYASSLKTFASSSSNFRILHSLPSNRTLPPPKTLYILDSSFNPPTLAHLCIATTALLEDTRPTPFPKRLLLLLATQNADKAPKPATFEQRLLMMQLFAQDLLSNLQAPENSSTETEDIGIDIGVIKLPYFMDKAKAVEESGAYPKDTPQVHLTGFDTLIRILDPKYYPPSHNLEPLRPFLEKHRLRVIYRTDDQWGERKAQDEYLKAIGEGKRDGEGARREWMTEGRIEMVEGRRKDDEVVSSTRVRDAVRAGNAELLKKLITDGVAKLVLEESLYRHDD
jgi:nicotinamide-nucleotide adenylyltransferase